MESHYYSTVLRWSSGLDNVSFAYIIVNNDKTFCHAFQCLDLSEVSIIGSIYVVGHILINYLLPKAMNACQNEYAVIIMLV